MKQLCGCCAGIAPVTPEPEANRPGLSALVYRVGTHESFLETMLVRLTTLCIEVSPVDGSPSFVTRPLAGKLTTRTLDDPSIALLDAWATVADVLTFYQERIANEGFLRTATERRSILELSRLIGYRLRPAVSATVYLAFTVADGFQDKVPAGTRAQSIPRSGTGEKPQFFETAEDLPTRDVWNNLKPRLTRPQTITLKMNPGTDALTRDTIYFQGIATNISRGDALLFVFGDEDDQQVLRTVLDVDVQTEKQRTQATLAEPPIQLVQGQSAFFTVNRALKPFVDEGKTLFADSDLGKEVVGILEKLLENLKALKPDPTLAQQQASALVREIIPQIQKNLDVARRRRFTRLKPWLAELLSALKTVAEQLLHIELKGGGGGGGKVVFSQSGLRASPLENLVGIVTALSRSPSLQPRSALALNRSTVLAFAPQADVAPRLLAAFHPAAAKTLYHAWAGVETPTSQVIVSAARAKAALFASTFAGAATVTQKPSTANDGSTISSVAFSPTNVGNTWVTLINDNGRVSAVALDTTYDRIKPGSWAVIDRPSLDPESESPRTVTYHQVLGAATQTMDTRTGFAAKVTVLTLDPPWLDELNESQRADVLGDTSVLRSTVVYTQTEELELAEEPLDTDIEGNKLELAQLHDGLEVGRWIIVSGERTDIPNTSGVRASELVMISAVSQGARNLFCESFPLDFVPFSQWAYTTDANVYGDRLVVGYIAPDVLADVLQIMRDKFSSGPTTFNQQFCDSVQLAPGVYANAYVPTQDELDGRFADFDGLLVDPETQQPFPGGQLSFNLEATEPQLYAWRVSTQAVHTILTLANNLSYKYDPETVVIYGNVVKATHGQTTGEVLGNGDASQALQKFALHQSPLTYLSAPTPSGAQSTLTVRVNEVEWHEADNLASLTARDREYVTEIDDSDRVTTIFGNGQYGARVPTGLANVKAVYRYGCGKVGNVDAQQISQLATQPLGVKSVINPQHASGGADHDTRDQARRNAPLAVMALDRLVSVRDYADFARTYAGIGKAAAARLSDGHTLLVHLTIAGKDDIPIDLNSDLYLNLVQALEQFGDPHQPLRVALRRLKMLVISAGIKVLPDYGWNSVGPAVKAAILDFYSFENRELGQSAFLSEAVAVLQAVPGVEYVDMRTFDSVAQDVTAAQLAGLWATLKVNEFVAAELATPDPNATDPALSILPAELVMLSPDVPDTLLLTEITA
jgi:hypothetical protein